MTDQTDVDRQDALDSAARHAARLLHAFGWLRVLVEPGREPRPAPPLLTDTARHWLGIQSAAEAADRVANLRAGLSAAPTGQVPIRLEMLTAQHHALTVVDQLVDRVERAGARARLGVPATGRNIVRVLDWLAGDGGPPCWAVTTGGVAYRRGALADVADLRVLDHVAHRLQEVADRARMAIGMTEERTAPYPHQPCPACRRRSLEIDATLRNERYWTVGCTSAACRCTGPGCPCLQRHAIEGRGHVWTYAELPTLHVAQQRHRLSHPVRSAAVGHGGWSSRRRGER
ncbi:hypothetical protein [Micromonospora sp. NPDC048063]|uniref:hypothetical protein n=1 Tax=Micromonospora sp. NPDC048063 TaxID=3364256 RepID=UPI00371FB210